MIPLFKVFLPPKAELFPELEKVLYSGYIGQGPKVDEFEREFGHYIGTDKVLTVNSGTSALHLALHLAGVEGGEVITTPMTCTATNFPILANRAKIVWGDIDPETGMLDPADVEKKITSETRAIMVVHWGGTPADLSGFAYLRQKYGIPIIEDAAHALGAEWEGRRIGNNTADYTCFSFQAIKHITTVDGGMLVLNSQDNYKRAKLLRWYGIDREGARKDLRCEEDVVEWGYKFHMNDVNATIGLIALKHLNEQVSKHRMNAMLYDYEIENKKIKKPRGYPGGQSSYWLYTLQVPKRDQFIKYMAKLGVATSKVHARNDTHTVLKEFKADLPGVDEFVRGMVAIPVHSGLTAEDLVLVSSACNNW